MDQLSRLGKRELICLLLFTCNYVVFVRRGFLFLWVLGMGYVILLWHSLSLPYNYFPGTDFGGRGLCDTIKNIRGHPIGPAILPKIFSCSSLSSTMFASLCNNVCKFVQLSLAGPPWFN